MKRFLIAFDLMLVVVFLAVWASAPTSGYGNNASGTGIGGGAHRSINSIAGGVYVQRMKNATEKAFRNYDFEPAKDAKKYNVLPLNGLVDFAQIDTLFKPTGEAIWGKSDWRDAKYESSLMPKSFKFSRWVIEGGFSADEPESFMSLRHFYNPVTSKGPTWLTDIPVANFRVMGANPQIDAITWATSHDDNAYNWTKGQEALMEAFTADRADEAAYAYAHAWRSLGECMHLMADMTLPAHVRNDSHPGYWYAAGAYDDLRSDVYEYFSNWYGKIDAAWSSRIVDPAIVSQIQAQTDVKSMYSDVAGYVNARYFSADTIPYQNWRGAWTALNIGFGGILYDSPRLETMTRDKDGYWHSTDALGNDIIMAHDSWLDDDGWDEYPKGFNLACAESQARRLVPIAVQANARLMELFIPKVELAVSEVGSAEDEESGEPVIYAEAKVFTVDGKGGYASSPNAEALADSEQTVLLFARLTDGKGKQKELSYLAPQTEIVGGKFEIPLEDMTKEGGLYEALHPARDTKTEDLPKIEWAVGLDMGGILVKSDWYGGDDITGLWDCQTTYESIDIPPELLDTSGMSEEEAKIFVDSMKMAYGSSLIGQTFPSQFEIIKNGSAYTLRQKLDAQTAAQMGGSASQLDFKLTLSGREVTCTSEQTYEGGGTKSVMEGTVSADSREIEGAFTTEMTFMVEGLGGVVWKGSWVATKVEP